MAFDNATGYEAYSSQLTFSHTVGTGPARRLYVFVAYNGGEDRITSVTYGGATLIRLGYSNPANQGCALYELDAPASGAANVVVTLTSIGNFAACAVSVDGVSGVSSYDVQSAFYQNSGTAISVAAGAGDLLLGWFSSSITTPAAGGGAGQSPNLPNFGAAYQTASTRKISQSASTQSLSFVWSPDNQFISVSKAIVAVPQSASDTTAPTLTSPTASATGATTASGSVSTNEANGTLYYIASANATELAATVKAGSSKAVTAAGAQTVTISGLTAATPYYPHYLHRDAAGNDSVVASGAQFTTGAAGDTTNPTLTGSVTFTSITQTSYTAQWPVGSDNVAVTGYEYQIGGTAGAWTNAGNNLSVAITGRTAGTTETVYVRAYDAAGLRSAPAISGEVTLLSTSTGGTITVGSALYPIKYSSASVLNESGLRATVLDSTTLAQVLNTSGVVCTNGVITITDDALVIGNTYHLAVKTANGWLGVSDGVTAS